MAETAVSSSSIPLACNLRYFPPSLSHPSGYGCCPSQRNHQCGDLPVHHQPVRDVHHRLQLDYLQEALPVHLYASLCCHHLLANCPTIKVVILLDIYLADKPKDLFPDEIQVYTLEEVCRSLSPPFRRSFPASLRTTPSTPSSTLVLLLMPTLPAARKATASAVPLSSPST